MILKMKYLHISLSKLLCLKSQAFINGCVGFSKHSDLVVLIGESYPPVPWFMQNSNHFIDAGTSYDATVRLYIQKFFHVHGCQTDSF